MKYIAWIALVVTLSAQSDIEIKTSRVSYGLGSYGDFTFNAYQIGYTHKHKGFAFTVLGGQSEKREGHYMRNFYSVAATYEVTAPKGLSLTAYVDISNGNDWSYTPSNPVPAGRPLNAGLVNDVSGATIDLGVTTGTITGEPDYPLFFADYYLETQGNRESVSTTGSSFFDKGRQIVMAPNQEILIRTQTSGTSTGTLELKTIFFISEVGLDEAPSILGM